jgi:spore germination protein
MKKLVLVMLVLVLLILAGVQTASASGHKVCDVHKVKKGENLYRIARKHGSTVASIVNANNIKNPSKIYVGEKLVIPCPGKPPAKGKRIHVVKRGDTLYSISRYYGVPMKAIKQANRIVNPNKIYVGQRLVIPKKKPPKPAGFWYTVKRGDTLSAIAWRFGVPIWSIVAANNLHNPNYIYTGQKLWIP